MKSVSNLKSDRAYEQLATWIRSGKFMPGNRLPSEQALSRELGVNHQTLRRGLEKLVTDGLVVKRPSVGNFVAELPDVVEIAVVLPDWMRKSRQQHPLTGLLLSGVHQKIDPRHHSVSIYYYRHGHLWADVGVVLASRRVRGAVISINYTLDPEDLRQLIDANIQVALIGNYPPGLTELGLPCFRYDPSLAIAPMMRRLYELGHREIAIFEYALEMPHMRIARHEVIRRITANWASRCGRTC
ncbi:MAG: GntR family transcriptional regulator [Phycisphaeraceae bacterium]|nr:GntR family transcriptional regulator [Phycisphaeraceae bacterium]